jgi:hypothetical protein
VADVLNPADIEETIRTISERISRSVTVCSQRYTAWKQADQAYDKAYAIAYMEHQGPAHEKKYAAELATEDERTARDAADAAYRYADRQAKALEAELRAYQSIGASVRGMYQVAGRGEQ